MPTSHKVLAVVLVILGLAVIFSQFYMAGFNHGYAAGWQDSHCGPGGSCESGDN